MTTTAPAPEQVAPGPTILTTATFIVSSKMLRSELAALVLFVRRDPIVPILENVLLAVTSEMLMLTTSNLRDTLTAWLPIESTLGEGESSRLCVEARLLFKLVSNLPEQPLTIRVQQKDGKRILSIQSENGAYFLPTEEALDYPKLPTVGQVDAKKVTSPSIGGVQAGESKIVNPVQFELDTDTLKRIIATAEPFTSTDDLRPAMTGLFFESTFAGTGVAATDGHRLIAMHLPSFSTSAHLKFILPREVSKAMLAIMSKSKYNTKVAVNLSLSQICFTWSGYTLTTKLIDERFPDYQNAIPRENPIRMVVDRRALLAVLNRVKDFANSTTHQIAFKIAPGGLTVTAEDNDYGFSCSEMLLAEVTGKDLTIGFNATILHKTLKLVKSKEVQLQFSQANRACVIFPYEDKKADESCLLLVMPVMLNDTTAW